MNDMLSGGSPMERGEHELEDDPLVTENNRLTDRIAELTAEVVRHKTDEERLDWCQENANHGSMPYYEDGKFNVTWLSRRAEGVCTGQFTTLREAIDFARNALKEGV